MAPVTGHFDSLFTTSTTSATATDGDNGASAEEFKLMKKPAPTAMTATMERSIQLLEPRDEFAGRECDWSDDAILNMLRMTLCRWMIRKRPADAGP